MSAIDAWGKFPIPPVEGSMKQTSELPTTKEPRRASWPSTMAAKSVAWLFAMQPADLAPIDPPCRDPLDNKFLALALASEADTLISSDEDLLVLHPWRGIPILTPAQFDRLIK